MVEGHLKRRSLLGIGAAGSLALLQGSLAGCSRRGSALASRRGDLPERWVERLPADWRVRWLEGPAQVVEACRPGSPDRPALVQLSDGWATAAADRAWAPLGHERLLQRLEASALPVSRLFNDSSQPSVAFPWSRNPWLLVLRDRPDLVERESLGWDLLLEPSLAGKVVLPSSPRVVMALVNGDPQRLSRLRQQALAQDDRHGLQLLLSGPAEAAVLPRPLVLPLLRRDPRLIALLPSQGAPTAWSLLLRPAGVPQGDPLGEWLEAILQPPLLPKVLSAGWVPPLPRPVLEAAVARFPAPLARLLLPPAPVQERCTNLPPLRPRERAELQRLWNSSQGSPNP